MGFYDQVASFTADSIAKVRYVVTGSLLELDARVAHRTPVDTGRARAGWQVAIDPDGLGGLVSNPVEYILPLEDGHSTQAPNGMVKETLPEWPDIVREVAGE